jgi:biopolymer transport protein ExbD
MPLFFLTAARDFTDRQRLYNKINVMAELQQSPGNRKISKVRRRRTSTRIDMTPMVDLAFLLLTFFVMTTTLNKQFIMAMQMPEKATDNPMPIPERRALTLILGEKNKVYWYQGLTNPKVEVTDFSSDGIREILTEKKQQIKNMFVLIKATDHSKYQNMVDILDELAISNIENYAIVDMTPVDHDLIALK